MGAAHYQCIKVLAETEFYDDLRAIDIPGGRLKSCPSLPHGVPTTHADQIAGLLDFIKS